MTLGPLVMVFAAMIVEWFILGSGDGKGGR
jgi:hypothetical protein